MSYLLFDAASHHRLAPESYCIPRADERNQVQSGEVVSLGLMPENSQAPEWLWVRVDVIREGARYIGALLEKPQTIPALEAGFRIEFTADHIVEIYAPDGDARWIDQSKLAMVSGYVASQGQWPGKLMRIPPMSPEYSGWLIFSGEEPPAYSKDFSNFVTMPLNQLIERFPNLKQVLASPTPSQWQWDRELAEYSPI